MLQRCFLLLLVVKESVIGLTKQLISKVNEARKKIIIETNNLKVNYRTS